jgi:hypothetical protein
MMSTTTAVDDDAVGPANQIGMAGVCVGMVVVTKAVVVLVIVLVGVVRKVGMAGGGIPVVSLEGGGCGGTPFDDRCRRGPGEMITTAVCCSVAVIVGGTEGCRGSRRQILIAVGGGQGGG